MVEIKDIVDRESLEGWLKGQPKEVSVWIAWRAAMRVLPFYWEWAFMSTVASKRDLTALPILRFYLISEVARQMPTSETTTSRAADAARASFSSTFVRAAHAPFSNLDAADTLADAAARVALAADATDAAFAATDVVLVAEFANSDAWNALRADCEAINKGHDLGSLKLWLNADDPLVDVWSRVKSNLPVSNPPRSLETTRGAVPVDWSFWIKWYDSVLAGEPLNGGMLKEIALIDPAEWEKGAKVVNPLIAEIVAQFEVESEGETTPQQALSQNFKAVIAQLETLKVFIEEEIIRIRSPNNITVEEQEQIKARVVALQGIIEAIRKMVAALADTDRSPENALVVIEEQLPKVFNEADKLAAQEPEISETIVVMGATVEHLTKRGMPGHVASGIAVADVVFRPIREWFKRNKNNE